jgi:transcriptional regulator
MYVPKFFEIKEWPEIIRFMKDNPLASLVSRGNEYPVTTHIPLELEENEGGDTILSGHFARANPQWKLFESHPEVLAIFLSPVQHYISSSWYNHPNVPTWNYMSIHVYGHLRVVEGKRLWKSLESMTHLHEQISSHPLTEKVLQGEIAKQIGGIVGFEIDIERVEAAYKMSQNRGDEDYKNVMAELEKLEDYKAKMVAKKMSEIMKTKQRTAK